MSSSNKKNSKSGSRVQPNGSTSGGGPKYNRSNSSANSSSAGTAAGAGAASAAQQQPLSAVAAPSTTPPPPKPAVNAWSKPLQTKAAAAAAAAAKPAEAVAAVIPTAAAPASNTIVTNKTAAVPSPAAAPVTPAAAVIQAATVAAAASTAATTTSNTASATPPPPPGYKPQDAASTAAVAAPPSKPAISKGPPGIPSNSEEELKNRDRALQMFLGLIGQSVKCHLKRGVVLEGVLHTATPFSEVGDDNAYRYLLKRTRIVSGKDDSIQDGSAVIIPMEQVVQLTAVVKLASLVQHKPSASGTVAGISSGGFTDAEISGTRSVALAKDRSLQVAGSAWTSGAAGGGASLESSALEGKVNSRAQALAGTSIGMASTANSGGLKGSIGGWDQFQANEALFNVRASYDESVYTTTLDRSRLDDSKIKRAEQLAKEIESAPSANIHLQQERNQSTMEDYDEEDLHSGVLRDVVKKPEKEMIKKTPPPIAIKKQELVSSPAVAVATTGSAPMNYAKALQQQKEAKQAAAAAKEAKAEAFAAQKEEDKVEVPKELQLPPQPEPVKPAMVEPTPAAPEPPKEEEKAPEPLPATSVSVQTLQLVKEPEKPIVVEEASSVATVATTASDEKSTSEDKQAKAKSKLNANAKEFTLNINAKSFTPTFSAPIGTFEPVAHSPPPHPPQQHHIPPPPQQQHHHHLPQYDMMNPASQYIPASAHMAQHGMVPMMNPQYRYAQGPYGEQQMNPHLMPQQQPQHMQGQQQGHMHPQMVGMHMQPPHPTGGGSTASSSPMPTDAAHDQDGGIRTGESDSSPHLLQQHPLMPEHPQQQQHPGGPHQQQHPQQQQHPMQQLPHGMHPQHAYYGSQMVQQRGPVPFGQPQYMQAPPAMYRPQMYPMGPPNVMTARPPYYTSPNGVPMPPGGPYGGYGGYVGGGNDDVVVVDGGYGRGGRGGGGGGGRGRGGRHQGRGGRHHQGRGGRGNNPGGGGGGGRGRFGGGGGSGRSTPEDGMMAAVVSPDPPPKKDGPPNPSA